MQNADMPRGAPHEFTDRGLNTFTSAVNFTALAQGRATGLMIPLQTFNFVVRSWDDIATRLRLC